MAGSIMDMFRSAPPQVRQEPQLAGSGAPQTTQVAGNPTVPSAAQPGGANPQGTGPAAFPATGTGEQSPLAEFQDLWKVDPNKPAPTQATLLPPMNLNAQQLSEAASKINFTATIPDEILQKAAAGDITALRQAIQTAGQFGFANAVAGAGELVNRSFTTAQTQLETQFLPGAIRQTQIQQTMAENPAFQDPAMTPLLTSLQSQLAKQYPTAQPAEIAGMAQRYLAGAAQKIVTGAGGRVLTSEELNQRNAMAAPEQDWEKFFG